MVLYGVSIFLGTPKDARKGRLRFIVISCFILVTSSIDGAFDMWRAFRVLFAGGQNGGKYAPAYQQDWITYSHIIVAGDSLLAVAITVGDILMVSSPCRRGAVQIRDYDELSFGAASCSGRTKNG
jgi:hypothetical protein